MTEISDLKINIDIRMITSLINCCTIIIIIIIIEVPMISDPNIT